MTGSQPSQREPSKWCPLLGLLTCRCSTSIIHPSDIMILFQKSSFPSIASVYSKAPIVFVVLTIHIICDLVFSQDRVWLQSDIHLNFPGTSLEWKKPPRRKRLVSWQIAFSSNTEVWMINHFGNICSFLLSLWINVQIVAQCVKNIRFVRGGLSFWASLTFLSS